jgi:DNA-binding NarL/FixJ family response regulator
VTSHGPPVARAPSSSTTVVLVDDHHVLTEALTGRLESEGDLRVVGVADAPAQALDVIAARRPDVVVLDLELGQGSELIERIRQLHPAGMIVGMSDEQDVEAALVALRKGAVGLVLKAAPVDDLVGAIRTAARGGVWLDQEVFDVLLAAHPEPTKFGRLSALTEREREVLSLMVEGLSYAAIAARLSLSVHTVRTHAHHLQAKLDVHSNVAAVALALSEGLRPPGGGEGAPAGAAGRP